MLTDRIPESPPIIDPQPLEVARPQWSIMIPTYNCIHYIKKTIESVLSQDRGPADMQIEVIDDFSTDGDVEALVQEVGKGRVGFFRQKENRGSLRNFETCLQRAEGHWVHMLHGDDMVKNGFYDEIEKLFITYPEAGAAFTGILHIDEKGVEGHKVATIMDQPGIIKNWLFSIAQAQRLHPPAIVVKRKVYEHLGGYYAVHYGEDWEMYVRIAAHYPVAYSPVNLALYRKHTNNITSRAYSTGQHIKDLRKVINIIQNYLPENKRMEITRGVKRIHSVFFARIAHEIYRVHQNPGVALSQAHSALFMQVNKTTIVLLAKLYVKCIINYRKNIRNKNSLPG